MNVESLFCRVLEEWPDECDISDGYPGGETGFMFPTLNHYWDMTEKKWDSSSDEWIKLGIWVFFQSAHQACVDAHGKGERSLLLSELDPLEFERNLRKNLEDPSWSREREQLSNTR